MSRELLEQLRTAGLLTASNTPDSAAIRRLSVQAIIDLSEQAREVTAAAFAPRARSVFEHSSSLSLGGGRFPCGHVACRRHRVLELSQFAALYSDRVYIRNFLTDFSAHKGNIYHEPDDLIHVRVAEDISVLAELAPLMEAGRVIAVTPPGNRCPACLWNKEGDEDTSAEFRPGYLELVKEFERSLRVRIRPGPPARLEVDASRDLLEHPIVYPSKQLPETVRRRGSIFSALRAGKTVELDRATRLQLGYHRKLADQVMRNVIFEKVVADALGTSLLSERPIHLRLLDKLGAGSEIAQRNQIVEEHLTALLPFVTEMSPQDLVLLREREEESFILFRQHLNQAVDAVRSRKATFTRRDAQQIQADILAPAVAAISQKVTTAKRELVKNSWRPALAWTGAISFGIYAGYLPESLAALAGAVGLTKVVQQLTESAMLASDADTAARREPLYFLWKVQQAARR